MITPKSLNVNNNVWMVLGHEEDSKPEAYKKWITQSASTLKIYPYGLFKGCPNSFENIKLLKLMILQHFVDTCSKLLLSSELYTYKTILKLHNNSFT